MTLEDMLNRYYPRLAAEDLKQGDMRDGVESFARMVENMPRQITLLPRQEIVPPGMSEHEYRELVRKRVDDLKVLADELLDDGK